LTLLIKNGVYIKSICYMTNDLNVINSLYYTVLNKM